MIRTSALLAAAFLMTACELSVNGPPPPEPPRPDACGASRLQPLIGRPVKDLKMFDTPERVRIYQTGQSLTMDYFPDRLNVETDADGRVVSVHCG